MAIRDWRSSDYFYGASLRANCSGVVRTLCTCHPTYLPGFWVCGRRIFNPNLATIVRPRTATIRRFILAPSIKSISMEPLEYAYLQIGEDGKAETIANGLGNVREQYLDNGHEGYLNQKRADFPAMYAPETHPWKDAVALQPPSGRPEPENGQITQQARAVGSGHLRDAAAAQDAVRSI